MFMCMWGAGRRNIIKPFKVGLNALTCQNDLEHAWMMLNANLVLSPARQSSKILQRNEKRTTIKTC